MVRTVSHVVEAREIELGHVGTRVHYSRFRTKGRRSIQPSTGKGINIAHSVELTALPDLGNHATYNRTDCLPHGVICCGCVTARDLHRLPANGYRVAVGLRCRAVREIQRVCRTNP